MDDIHKEIFMIRYEVLLLDIKVPSQVNLMIVSDISLK